MMKNELNRRGFLKWANLLGLSAALPGTAAAGDVILGPFETQEKSASRPAAL